MPFAADHLKLDLQALPWSSDRLGAAFYLGTGNNTRPLLMMKPAAGQLTERRQLRYAADVILTLADGTVVRNLAQLVVTAERLLGMVIRGSAGSSKLDAGAGEVFAFSASLRETAPPTGKKNWRGAVTRVTVRPADGLPKDFVLAVNSVIGKLDDEGTLTFGASLAELIPVLTRDAAMGLGEP